MRHRSSQQKATGFCIPGIKPSYLIYFARRYPPRPRWRSARASGYLIENSGRLVSKDELFAAIWPNIAVTDDALVQSIGELRRALGDDGPCSVYPARAPEHRSCSRAAWPSDLCGFVRRLSELIDADRCKGGSDYRFGSLSRNLFNGASKHPSAPSESDNHRNESAGGCALQETLERVSRLKEPWGHQYTLSVLELWSFTR